MYKFAVQFYQLLYNKQVRKISTYSVCLLAIFLYQNPILAQTKEKTQIAVTDLDSQGSLSQQEIIILTNRLRSKLVRTNAFIMLDRGLMEEILEEQGFQQGGCTTTECAVEIGKILNVQQIITGTVGKFGTLFTIDISLIDVGSSQIVLSLTRDYSGEMEGLIGMMGSIANELAGVGETTEVKDIIVETTVSSFGSLEISSTPSQAMVYINGMKLGLTPFKLNELKTGEHILKLTKNGYIDYEGPFLIVSGKNEILEMALERLNIVNISSNPSGALFYLDDELKGSTPVIFELRSGVYKLKILKEGFSDWEQDVTINKDYSSDITLLKLYNVEFISTPPQVDVFLNNKYIGSTPFTSPVAAGKHQVSYKMEGYNDFSSDIKLKKDMQVKAKLKPLSKFSRQPSSTAFKGKEKSLITAMTLNIVPGFGIGHFYTKSIFKGSLFTIGELVSYALILNEAGSYTETNDDGYEESWYDEENDEWYYYWVDESYEVEITEPDEDLVMIGLGCLIGLKIWEMLSVKKEVKKYNNQLGTLPPGQEKDLRFAVIPKRHGMDLSISYNF